MSDQGKYFARVEGGDSAEASEAEAMVAFVADGLRTAHPGKPEAQHFSSAADLVALARERPEEAQEITPISVRWSELTKVVAGPAGHWYALVVDPQFGENLIGLPQMAGEDLTKPPAHPAISGDFDGWCDIEDPAPGVDDAKIIAEIKGLEV